MSTQKGSETPQVVVVDRGQPERERLRAPAAALRRGELVAFPTETVYGLGANALDAEAIAKIYEAKGRPANNPLIVHVPDLASAKALAARWPEEATRLAEAFWPGPLTLVVPRKEEVVATVSAGLDTVGLRVPAHPVARALLEEAGVPVAAPSANLYTQTSPTRAAHVLKSLGGRVGWVIDGGATEVGVESTVVSLAGEVPVLLRPGMVSLEALREVVGEVHTLAEAPAEDAPRQSPGLARRHYAPGVPLRVREKEAIEADLRQGRGQGVGCVVREALRCEGAVAVVLPRDAAGFAAGLYDALHRLERLGVDAIWVEAPPGEAAWEAIRDRLDRAAH
ncbi:threonylcarbamoyl-AMP synthase [Lujinxingia litoralis]|uniref:Threonylcarbamoyl-AMP synthase n=1 Tax=Lujinxingia litoralis TaxID=2211119 RepID=A0A328C191_9DELT|nr:L-threonylcarbamoyladenylate synthase [Lujinxingia litoralis]RAL20059.1 threonylcarbamoyl-AMP synthase [Lujinxingia litoralis]